LCIECAKDLFLFKRKSHLHYSNNPPALIPELSSENQCWQGFPKINTGKSPAEMLQQSHKILVPCGFGAIADNADRRFFFVRIKNLLNLLPLPKHYKIINHEQS
jgi:hypothetical protein